MTLVKEILEQLFEMIPSDDIEKIRAVRAAYPEVEHFKCQFIMELLQTNGIGKNHNTAQTLRMLADIMDIKIDIEAAKKMNEKIEEIKNKEQPHDKSDVH